MSGIRKNEQKENWCQYFESENHIDVGIYYRIEDCAK